ncbi:MAG: hypothetical protein AAF937_05935 [Planctomycetota bacterium]
MDAAPALHLGRVDAGDGTVMTTSPKKSLVEPGFADATRFEVFLRLFAAFAIIHTFIGVRDWAAKGSVSIVATLVALFAGALVITKPSSSRRVATMAAAMLVVEINMMPYTPNHVLVTSLIAGVLLVAALQGLRRADWTAAAAKSVGPAIRVGLVTVYGFAVLHKLNADYFDPEVSCGPYLHRQLKTFLPFIPIGEWVNWPTLIGSLVIELALGVLLLVRRTRMLAIAGGLLFHGLLAFHVNGYVMSFSVLIMPLYALFVPLAFYRRIADVVDLVAAKLPAMILTWLRLVPLCGVALGVGYFAFRVAAHDQPDIAAAAARAADSIRGTPRAVAVLFIFAGSAIFYLPLLRRPSSIFDADEADAHAPRWPAAGLFALLTFNGLCPYLGFKTQTSFSMFSNLRTELGETNHFFMPSLTLSEKTADMVAVHESTHWKLQLMADAGELIPFFELQRYAAHDPDFTVSYTPWGETDPIFASRDGSSDPRGDQVFDTPPLLLRKVIGFRSVPPPDEPCTCRH